MSLHTIGPYEVLRETERTPFCRVFSAHDSETGTAVRLRLVEREARELGADLASLRRACGALVGLSHPNLVGVLDVDEWDGLPYLVTEMPRGTPASGHLRAKGLLPPATVCEIVAGAARGLHRAHLAGVVHGDLEPAWVLRAEDGSGLLDGFGLVALAPVGATGVRGVPGYLAPEQIRGEAASAASDVFALGAVLFELLTGRRAFGGESESAVFYRTVHEEPESAALAAVPPALAPIVSRALAKDKAARFTSAEEFALALETADVGLDVEATLGPGESPGPSRTLPGGSAGRAAAPRATPLRPFVLAVTLAAVGGLALFLLRDRVFPRPLLEARVRTDPPGIAVLQDGQPIPADGVVRFRRDGTPALLTARLACRVAEHRLAPADAAGEIVLALDPVEAEVQVDPGVDGATLALNGTPAGRTPLAVRLDLCRPNRLELQAPGFRPAAVDLPAEVDPATARGLVSAVVLAPTPKGRLRLPASAETPLTYFVDGQRVTGSTAELELAEGAHELRYTNEAHWLEGQLTVELRGGETTTPAVDTRLGTLVVQAFPSNCEVFLRRPGGAWRRLDETPVERRLAVGAYEVKVVLKPTGESRVVEVELKDQENPPVRVSFAGRS